MLSEYDDLKYAHGAAEDTTEEDGKKLQRKVVTFNDSHTFYDDEARSSEYDEEQEEEQYVEYNRRKEEVEENSEEPDEDRSTMQLADEDKYSEKSNFDKKDNHSNLEEHEYSYEHDEDRGMIDKDLNESHDYYKNDEEYGDEFTDADGKESPYKIQNKFEVKNFNDSNVIRKAHQVEKLSNSKGGSKRVILEKRKDLRSNEFDLRYTENDALKTWVKSKDAEIRRIKKEERAKRKKLNEERKQRKNEQEKRRQEAQLEYERWAIVKNKELQENKREMLQLKLITSNKKSSFDETSSHASETLSDKFVERKNMNNLSAAKFSNTYTAGVLNKRYSSDPSIHKPNFVDGNNDSNMNARTKRKIENLHSLYSTDSRQGLMMSNGLSIYIKPNLIKNISFSEWKKKKDEELRQKFKTMRLYNTVEEGRQGFNQFNPEIIHIGRNGRTPVKLQSAQYDLRNLAATSDQHKFSSTSINEGHKHAEINNANKKSASSFPKYSIPFHSLRFSQKRSFSATPNRRRPCDETKQFTSEEPANQNSRISQDWQDFQAFLWNKFNNEYKMAKVGEAKDTSAVDETTFARVHNTSDHNHNANHGDINHSFKFL